MSTSPQTKRVAIFKKKDKDDKYDELFKEQGYTPEFIPVLDHQLENIDILKDVIMHGPQQDNIGGLIVTSQRSVEALCQACQLALLEATSQSCKVEKNKVTLFQKWKNVPAYIVGPQTAEALAQTPLFHDSHDSKDINSTDSSQRNWIIASRATELIAPLLDHYAENQRLSFSNGTTTAKANISTLLFLSGDKRRDVIPEALKKACIPFEELQVYATCAHPELNQNLNDYLSKHFLLSNAATTTANWWTVYFSPSGIKFLLSSVTDPKVKEILLASTTAENSNKQRPRIAAIGPTTADYLSTSLEIKPDVIADKPDAMHLVQSILDYDMKNQ